MATNYRQLYAIQKKNEQRLLAVNPNLNNKPGIYFLTRTDENGVRHGYVGQATTSVLQRMCSHLTGYKQHIDLSLRKYGLYAPTNPYGWKVGFLNFPVEVLDEKEKYYIKQYADAGYQLKNVSSGGQAGERSSGDISARKEPKGYRDGIAQGRKNLARELKDIIEKHLSVEIKPEKANNKVSQKQFEKFKELLSEEEKEINSRGVD